jgi:hypothetical protein
LVVVTRIERRSLRWKRAYAVDCANEMIDGKPTVYVVAASRDAPSNDPAVLT